MSDERRDQAIAIAHRLGFHRAGVCSLEEPAHYGDYQAWLERGDHGSMSYMADEFHQRARKDARELLPSARSAIVVALAYEHRDPPAPDDALRGWVARYARGKDYHQVIRAKLDQLAEELRGHWGEDIEFRPCVDSAPLLERELAERAGLGFVGKNTMLISPGLGSYTLLGVLLCGAELAASSADELPHCGSCRLCLDACPTQAFRRPFVLDARRCISYLTIESRAPIPDELRPALGPRIFGCDECQSVCPYNQRAPERNAPAPELAPFDEERGRPELAKLASLGSNQRKRYLATSPLRRTNRDQLLRNIAAAAINAGDEAVPLLDQLREDRSELAREQLALAVSKEPPP